MRKNRDLKAITNQIDIEKEPPVKKARTVRNSEDPTTFYYEFSKPLEYIYFSDTCNKNDDIETCNAEKPLQ